MGVDLLNPTPRASRNPKPLRWTASSWILLSVIMTSACITTARAQNQARPNLYSSESSAGPAAETDLRITSIEREIEQLIASSDFAEAVWSVIVRPADGDSAFLSIRPGIIQPASNQKLLTTGALLDLYGPEHRFRTRVWIDGEVSDGRLDGDLVVRGMGDPSIGASFLEGSPFAFFDAVADSLRRLGVQSISGDLIGDIGWFDGMAYPPGWSWDDMPFYYAVPVGPLSFRENTVDLEVDASGALGGKPAITWFPFETDYVRFINEQVIDPPGSPYKEGYDRIPGSNTIHLTSRLPQGMIERESLSIHDPGGYFVDTFVKVLERSGIEVLGRGRVVSRPFGWEDGGEAPLLEYESPPLAVLLSEMNQESSNFISEMLVKTLSAERSGAPGTTEDGVLRIRGRLSEMGLDTARIRLNDGSGLAAGNLVSSDELNRFLVIMRRHPHADVYLSTLAVNGRSGTLRNRLRNGGMDGAFRGKTGYVSGVRTLSGYLTTRAGGELAVTLATNHAIGRVSDIDRIHNAILTLLHERFP